MWTCPNCKRIFQRIEQPHSCRIFPLEKHFKNKEKARGLFDYLIEKITKDIGKNKIISLPCCIHLFGNYDFLAALPKKEKLEIHFVSNHILKSPRIRQWTHLSNKNLLNSVDISRKDEIDNELMRWIDEAYHAKTIPSFT